MDSLENYLDNYVTIHDRFDMLYRLVMDSPVNVTAIKDEREFALKHILDSIYFFIKHPIAAEKMLDIGSGGGFPGLVLAIYYPDMKVTVADSIRKKCDFMKDAASKLGLKNVRVINSRVEEIVGEKFDLFTARGVGSVKEILTISGNLASARSSWLMYKGERLDAELEDAKNIIEKRGLQIEKMRIEVPFTRSYLYLHP